MLVIGIAMVALGVSLVPRYLGSTTGGRVTERWLQSKSWLHTGSVVSKTRRSSGSCIADSARTFQEPIGRDKEPMEAVTELPSQRRGLYLARLVWEKVEYISVHGWAFFSRRVIII